MSQIYKTLTSTGPIPPNIPTSFVTQNGTAVPAANILLVKGFDSIENNANGIISKGGVVGTGTSNEVDIILTNRTKIISTTSDGAGQTQTVNIFTPTASTGITFVVSVTGYDSINNEMAGGEIIGLATTSSLGVVSIVGSNDTFDDASPALAATDWNIVTDGTQIQIEFVGVAGRTINWSSIFTYDTVG